MEKILFFGEILRKRNNGYTFGYRFVVDNQEMMSFGYSDNFKTWDLFSVEFKNNRGPEEFLARSEIDFYLSLFKG